MTRPPAAPRNTALTPQTSARSIRSPPVGRAEPFIPCTIPKESSAIMATQSETTKNRTPRRTAREIAQDTLDKAKERVTRANKRIERLKGEQAEAERELTAAQRARNYAEQHPDLQPNGEPEGLDVVPVETELNEADGEPTPTRTLLAVDNPQA